MELMIKHNDDQTFSFYNREDPVPIATATTLHALQLECAHDRLLARHIYVPDFAVQRLFKAAIEKRVRWR